MGMDYSRAADWIVAENTFDPEHLGKCESVMCQGNGYLCLRNATDEFNPGEQRDLFVAGTFNKFDDNEVTELPNAADISRLDLRLDGVRFSLLTGKVESYDRALHLKNGETVRRVVWAAPNGKRYQLVFSRFVSMERLHLIAQKLSVTPLNGAMTLDIAGGINGQMNNGGSQHFSEGDKRLFEGRHMQYIQTTGQSNIDFVFNTTFSFAMDGVPQEEKGFIVMDPPDHQAGVPGGHPRRQDPDGAEAVHRLHFPRPGQRRSGPGRLAEQGAGRPGGSLRPGLRRPAGGERQGLGRQSVGQCAGHHPRGRPL